jgi:hypothetical protein
MKCPRCEKEIDCLKASYEEHGSCLVYPDGTDDQNPFETILSNHRCPICDGEITVEEAADLTE